MKALEGKRSVNRNSRHSHVVGQHALVAQTVHAGQDRRPGQAIVYKNILVPLGNVPGLSPASTITLTFCCGGKSGLSRAV